MYKTLWKLSQNGQNIKNVRQLFIFQFDEVLQGRRAAISVRKRERESGYQDLGLNKNGIVKSQPE